MKKLIDKAATLIEALPYLQEFRNNIVVIKFGGSAMEDPELVKQTMRDIVFLEIVGMKPVVVHGGGKAITAQLENKKIETRFINGLRYTCKKTLSVVDDVLHNQVNTKLLHGFSEAGGKGHSLSGKHILKASKAVSSCPETGRGLDIGYVGNIKEVDSEKILALLEQNIVPIIPPLGLDADGQKYNINADIAACKIASALKAGKLIFLSDVPGLLKDAEDENSLISTIKAEEIKKMVKNGGIKGGMIPKMNSALEAIEAGTKKVHMIDGRIQHSLLLEIFTDKGIGTEIVGS